MLTPAEASGLQTSLLPGQRAGACLGRRNVQGRLAPAGSITPNGLALGSVTFSAWRCTGIKLQRDFSGQKSFQLGKMCWARGTFCQFLVFLPLNAMRAYPGVHSGSIVKIMQI